MTEHVFSGQTWTLLPEKAVYWASQKTLIVSDLHFGKAAAFRVAGIPVPAGNTAKDLLRLTQLLEMTEASHLLLLGDLLHARTGRQPETMDAIARWRQSHSRTHITLVRGNHDRHAGPTPPDWGLEIFDQTLEIEGIRFQHAPPDEAPEMPTCAGHIHPMVSLRDFDGSRLSVPCFVFDPASAILPAFGSLTGGCRIEPGDDRRIYVAAGSKIVKLAL